MGIQQKSTQSSNKMYDEGRCSGMYVREEVMGVKEDVYDLTLAMENEIKGLKEMLSAAASKG